MVIKSMKLKKALQGCSIALGVSIVLYSCSDKEKINLEKFEIVVPLEWETKVIEKNDGYNGVLLVQRDSIFFNFGIAVSNLAEKEPNVVYIPLRKEQIYEDFDTSKFVLAEKQFFDMDEYRKQNVSFAVINGLPAKLTYPRRSGRGLTGVYIDSIKYEKGLSHNLGFHLFGNNLSPTKERELLKAITTVVFKDAK